ncbi:MAG TPA: 4Fe-4S dicluster domain-containing protein [Thermotogales bacterium]|nr:4Fe-4S dicluster domain-containing protein [Thermotogales bacterium]
MRTERMVLHFPGNLADKPIIVNLVRKFDLNFNILKATITPEEEGIMVLEISGDDEKFEEGMKYLERMGVGISPLSKEVIWIEEKCVHCGYCVNYCPTSALSMNDEYRVEFDPRRCTTCGICVELCPFKAVEMRF